MKRMKYALGMALATGCLAAFADDFVWPTSGTVTIPSGATYVATEADMAKVNALDEIVFADLTSTLKLTGKTAPKNVTFSGVGTIVKDSGEDWTIETSAGAKFKGKYVLKGGMVTPKVKAPFGSTEYQQACSLWIEDGATLYCSPEMKGSELLNWTEVHIAGEGKEVNGVKKGAIWVDFKQGTGNKDIRVIVLDDDATVYADEKEKYFYHNGTLNLNSHTLTVAGKGDYYLVPCAVTGGGEISLPSAGKWDKRTLCINGNTTFEVQPDGSLTKVRLGDALRLEYREGALTKEEIPTQNAELIVSGSVTFFHDHTGKPYPEGEYADNVIEWAGPIRLADANTILNITVSYVNDCMIDISGPISGPGSVTMNDVWSRVRLSNPTNSFTGSLTVTTTADKSGSLALASSNSVPDYAAVTASVARVALMGKSDGSTWAGADIVRFANAATFLNGAFLSIDTSESSDGTYLLPGSEWSRVSDSGLALAADGGGTLTLTGPLADRAYPMAAVDGTLRLTGPDKIVVGTASATTCHKHEVGSILVEDAADVRIANNVLALGSPAAVTTWADRFGSMVIRNSLLCDPMVGDYSSPSDGGGIYCGWYGAGALDIESGSVVTSKVYLGFGDARSCGSVFQKGGRVTLAGSKNDTYRYRASNIGGLGHGYYELSGGECHLTGRFPIGGSGWGTYAQYGGTTRIDEHFAGQGTPWTILANDTNGRCVLYLKEGDFESNGNLIVGLGDNYDVSMTLDGPGTHFVQKTSFGTENVGVSVGYANNGRFLLNLNAGVFEANGIAMHWTNRSATPDTTYLNFNGGTYRINAYKTILENNPAYGYRSYVNVYGGGMVVDTVGAEGKVSLPIEQASGNGVVSVPLPAGLESKDMETAPYIEISGDGINAQAIALYDRATKRVTGVRVTCPGRDYSTKPTATFRIGTTLLGTSTCELAANGKGSLTKEGAGTLTLNAVNAYEGETVLAGGTLKCGVDGSLPAGSTIVFAGGKLNLDGKKLSDGSSLPKKFRVGTAEGSSVVYPGEFTFDENAVLTVSGVGNLGEDVKRLTVLTFSGVVQGAPKLVLDGTVSNPDDWKLRWVAGTVKLSRTSGMVVVIR